MQGQRNILYYIIYSNCNYINIIVFTQFKSYNNIIIKKKIYIKSINQNNAYYKTYLF